MLLKHNTYHIMLYRVHLVWARFELTTLVIIIWYELQEQIGFFPKKFNECYKCDKENAAVWTNVNFVSSQFFTN
jgi:hypothetical protein